MPPAARVSDMHVCPMVTGIVPHVGGPILPPGAVQVLIGFLPAARVGDMLVCVGPPDVIAKGSMTVLIGGQPAARMGDLTAHGGTIVLGFPTVMIGDAGGGGGGGGGASGGVATAGTAGAAGTAGNGPFATQDAAATNALTAANTQSIAANREYGGVIYRGSDGQYYSTGPAAGTDQGFNPASAPAPAGTTVVGDYHTHGDYSTADPKTGAAVRTSDPAHDDFNSDQFSATDKTGIAADGAGVRGYAGYLGTPSGGFRRYDPATGADTKF